ncbi:hypothetical protein GCM10027195_03050 [Comamonas sediminis]
MNLAKLFEQVLPKRPLQVGDVVESDGSICTVELPGGGRLRARGDMEVGEKVFVRDGVIEGQAPNLPLMSIQI